MTPFRLRKLILAGLLCSVGACGGDRDASAQSGAHKAAEDGKQAVSDLQSRLEALRGGRSGDGTQAGSGDPMPDWFPEDIWLPDDFSLVSAQMPLPHTYIVHGMTALPKSEALSRYRKELAAAGYEVVPSERTPSGEQVIFSLNGLEGGQVVVRETDGRTEIRVDFTKERP